MTKNAESKKATPVAEEKLDRWEQRGLLPMSIAVVAFVAAYAWPILNPALLAGPRQVCRIVLLVIWAIFAIDYFIRLYLARDKWRFFRGNLIDLVVVAAPNLSPIRLVRLLVLVRLIGRFTGRALRGRIGLYVVCSTVIVVLVGALAVLDAERRLPEGAITTYGDALWWAIVTITTVGYGDLAPATTEGRIVAALMMLFGIALLGVITGLLATFLVDKVSLEKEAEAAKTDTTNDLAGFKDEIRDLRTELAALRADLAQQSPLPTLSAAAPPETHSPA